MEQPAVLLFFEFVGKIKHSLQLVQRIDCNPTLVTKVLKTSISATAKTNYMHFSLTLVTTLTTLVTKHHVLPLFSPIVVTKQKMHLPKAFRQVHPYNENRINRHATNPILKRNISTLTLFFRLQQ